MQHKQEKYVDGDFKGLKFFVPVFEKLSEAVESYTEATVLALLNQQVQSRLRTKVKNSLPKNLPTSQLERYKEELYRKHPDGCVFSIEDCKSWHPTVRGLSARKLFMMSQAAVAKGDLDEAKELMEQCKAKTLA
ncbi:hypothetical protein CMI37_05710 [Candidatus Pacearchaeota archaeon]|nr:hypothetical protein [Candidatus Pacearchaeota archaeon]|tara:strand:+ start:3182 stop:3583 length:402 start_codon:yes stop_codon:yes gene_type:complete